MIIDVINNKILEYTKSRDSVRLAAMKEIKTALAKEQKSGKPYTDETETKVLVNLVNTYKKAIEEFSSMNTDNAHELIEKYSSELAIIQEYAPKEPTVEEITQAALDIIENLESKNGCKASMKDMKTILSELKKVFPVVNGKIVSDILKTR